MELTKETNSTATSPHSQALSQLIEFSWKATRGLVKKQDMNWKWSIVLSMPAKSPPQSCRLSALISQRMADSRKTFLQNIDTHVRSAVKKSQHCLRVKWRNLKKTSPLSKLYV
ncbi:MAG: hypothetical protein R2877_01900 [Bdellovibrionota bacterium]